MRKSRKFPPEVVERAVRMVFDAKDQYPSQWAAIESIAGKIGCTAETLRRWVRQGERDGRQALGSGKRCGKRWGRQALGSQALGSHKRQALGSQAPSAGVRS
jgi:transposase-like protein